MAFNIRRERSRRRAQIQHTAVNKAVRKAWFEGRISGAKPPPRTPMAKPTPRQIAQRLRRDGIAAA
jgi:hypothetical protein